jgi:CheY-like chemotaxis protein
MTAVQILLVVDEEDRALELRQQVESLGYGIVGSVRADGETLEGVSELCPDLIIWDIGMPRDPRSLPFVEEVRRAWSPISPCSSWCRNSMRN